MTDGKKDIRTRNFTFIQYDDSSVSDWRDKLDALHIPWVESPLHDSDLNGDNTEKKPHRHIGFKCKGKKSFAQMQEISNLVSGVKPEPIHDMRAFVRYLIHRDNPEKHQYNINDIICHCGFDIGDYFTESGRNKREILKEIFAYIRENKIVSFSDFVDICYSDEHFDEWSEIVTDQNTLIIKEYIKSYAWRHKEINPETGEITYEGFYKTEVKKYEN